jgi:hypothetical protein
MDESSMTDGPLQSTFIEPSKHTAILHCNQTIFYE